MDYIMLFLMLVVDKLGATFNLNTVKDIDTLNQLYYIFYDHPVLNWTLLAGLILTTCIALTSLLKRKLYQ